MLWYDMRCIEMMCQSVSRSFNRSLKLVNQSINQSISQVVKPPAVSMVPRVSPW